MNFSAADLGGTPAILALLLYSSWGWNVYLAAGSGLVSAIVLGVIVEFAFLRRFFHSAPLDPHRGHDRRDPDPRRAGLALPIWMGNTNTVQFPDFINLNFTVGSGLTGTKFFGNDVLTLIVVPVILLGLTAFFRFSSVGVALRATAENADRASLLGIPVRRLQSVVWGLAAFLAFVAMFLRIGVNGPSFGQVLDPALLLSALGAAVIGRMERLPSVTCAAIGFGIVSQAARYHYASDAYRSAIIASIIVFALLIQRRRHALPALRARPRRRGRRRARSGRFPPSCATTGACASPRWALGFAHRARDRADPRSSFRATACNS